MRVFNEDKTQELNLNELDFTKGYLKSDKLLITHHEAVEAVKEQGHYETIKEYPNGGKDVEWIVDVPAVESREAYSEYEDISIYIQYTEKELANHEVANLKSKLAATDYQAIKYAEGLITPEKYAEIKERRQTWRNRINELEEVVK